MQFQAVPSDPVEAGKMELMKMRTLERRAKICEMQRFTKAQVSALISVQLLKPLARSFGPPRCCSQTDLASWFCHTQGGFGVQV